MRVLVTGGLGVNGSWVLRELVRSGLRPICFDYADDTKLVVDLLDNMEVVKGNISDLEQVKGLFRKYEVDSVIHMAALVSPDVTSVDPAKAVPMKGFEVNGRGTMNIFEAARLTDVNKIVYTSSKGIYGEITGSHGYPDYVPMTEDYPTNPSSFYDCTKLFGEELGAVFSKIYGIDFVALRFAQIYGPGKLDRHGAYALHDRIIWNALHNIPTEIETGGDTKDDLIYVRDVAKAHILALNTKRPGHFCYHFGTGVGTSLIEFGNVVRTLIPNAKIKIGHGVGYYGKGTPGTQCVMDCSRAEKELGYAPDFTIRKGIEDHIGWTKAHEVQISKP